MRGGLLVISGPSGVGKGTLRGRLFERIPSLRFSISCTTRSPRPGEVDGVDYRFIDDEEFQKRVAAHQFLEWAKVHHHCYGTLKTDVELLRNKGFDVVLEIDVQGARQVRTQSEEGLFIFVSPPSMQDLEQRLRGRGTESEEDIRCRLENARQEVAQADFFDYVVVNDDVESAVHQLERFILQWKGKKND